MFGYVFFNGVTFSEIVCPCIIHLHMHLGASAVVLCRVFWVVAYDFKKYILREAHVIEHNGEVCCIIKGRSAFEGAVFLYSSCALMCVNAIKEIQRQK